MLVISGGIQDVADKVDEWGVGEVVWEEESANVSRERDVEMKRLLGERNVKVTEMDGHMLLKMKQLEHAMGDGGKPPVTMNSFLTLAERAGAPDKPVDMVQWDGVGSMKDDLMKCEEYNVPESLELVGFEQPKRFGVNAPLRFKGGEDEAMRMMEEFLALENGKVAARFEKPMTNPAAFDPRETTALSPYLAHGMLSVRVFFWKLKDIQRRYKSHSSPPVSLVGQIMWREMTHFLGRKVEKFFQMEGNPVCRQIPWDKDEDARERLKAWQEARTGYPWIDALVTQLKSEGWVHHLGRHCIACFLTRGDLWVHWEEGAKAFEENLIDYDPCINAFSWMWMSCSAFFSQYFRVYGPKTFGQKRDKDGDLIRRYLPVLKNMPAKYIYEPWKAPLAVQKKSKCVIGTDYPKPIVDHGVVSKENIGRMKEAFAQNKEMKDERKTSAAKTKKSLVSNGPRKTIHKRRGRS